MLNLSYLSDALHLRAASCHQSRHGVGSQAKPLAHACAIATTAAVVAAVAAAAAAATTTAADGVAGDSGSSGHNSDSAC
jgi:hypothetical protein